MGASVANRLDRAHARAWARTPPAVALAGFLLYGLYAAVAIARHGAESFAFVAANRLHQSDASSTIATYAHVNSRLGYDGQYYLFMALDPVKGWHYMDTPTYRYTHILYPMVAHVATLGHPAWTTYALVGVSVVAVGVGTLFASMFLVARGYPAWLGSLCFLYPGLFWAFTRDLAEPLAFTLVAAGLWLALEPHSVRRIGAATAAFGLAGLTRETALLIPVCIGAGLVLTAGRSLRTLGLSTFLVLASIAPYAIWRAVVLHWIGPRAVYHPTGRSAVNPYPATFNPFSLTPYEGFIHAKHDLLVQVGVAFAGTVLLVACVLAVRRGWRDGVFIALCLSLLAHVVFLNVANYSEYPGAGRIQVFTVLFAAGCLGSLQSSWLGARLTRVAFVAAFLPLLVVVERVAANGFRPF